MTLLDWVIVFGLTGSVFVYGLARSRKTKSVVDWFLAGRTLPFWVVGISMFATNVDSGDYVAINGMTYTDGVAIFTLWWLGINLAYVLAAFVVVPPMYRAGLFTNAEYLEARFGPSTRLVSALVQLQYRTNVLAMVTISLQLLLTVVMGLTPSSAWLVAVGLAVAASLYAARGGLKTVAWADALLSVIMVASTFVLWAAVWGAVGGWDGATAKLRAQGGEELPRQLLHIGASRQGEAHPLLVVLALVILSAGYAVVNHTQVMKLFGARSLWDLKMSVVVGGALTMVMMYFCGSLGILGRALQPESLNRPDEIYPWLVREFMGTGLKGIVVSGVLAAAISTFQGIAAAMAAVFTRDVYARLIAPDKTDSHYLMISRVMTPLVVISSFAYIPFILRFETMFSFFVRFTSVCVTPLLTVYLMGIFTRVHRKSSLPGLLVGTGYGILAVVASLNDALPGWLVNRWASYPWSILFTATAMAGASLILKRTLPEETVRDTEGQWLLHSREKIPVSLASPFPGDVPIWASPGLWAGLLIAVAAVLVFWVFW